MSLIDVTADPLMPEVASIGRMELPSVTPKPVRTSKNPKDMLPYNLDNENETIRNYRDRIPQCEALGEYAEIWNFFVRAVAKSIWWSCMRIW